MRKMLLIFLSSIFVLAMLSACGGSSKDSDTPETATPNNETNQSSNTTDTNQSTDVNHTTTPKSFGDTSKDGTGISADTKIPASSDYRLLAWNDLGMHCMDGDDYSVFSILPPYNNLIAQFVRRENGDAHRITSDVTLTYEAAPSLEGKKYNTTSSTKTNFWDYAKKLFGMEVEKDKGLTGNGVQSFTPQKLVYNSKFDWWEATGIPTAPRNNDGTKNDYPLVRVTAKDTSGNVLASTVTVLPVSDEMDCKKCHASNSNDSAKPTAGWVNNQDMQKDYKLNILKLHDEKNNFSAYLEALKAKGYNYKNTLSETQASGTPILCAACHSSNALKGSGLAGLPPLTKAIHDEHAHVTDPSNNKRLDDANNRDACYACHPGSTTQCLRGAMGNAKNPDGSLKMQCQSCHGNMSKVGSHERSGWLDEPSCQSCHHDGKRETSSFMPDGTLRATLDKRFATNENKPATGKSLYRFSTGHKGMQCSACHGSTHAIYPSKLKEDNLQSIAAQGHDGTIAECTTCHKTTPITTTGGPHGMHTIGESWVDRHGHVAEDNNNDCKSCHGADFRGSPLSKMFSTRTLDGKKFERGHPISCYDCHDGPGGDS